MVVRARGRSSPTSRQLEGYHGVCAVAVLPQDLLEEIFKLVLSIKHAQYNRLGLRKYPEQELSIGGLRPPVALSHVCRMWRTVSLETAALWTRIELDIHRTNRGVDQARVWINRSKVASLDFIIDLTFSELPWHHTDHNDTTATPESLTDPLHRQIFEERLGTVERGRALALIERMEAILSILGAYFERGRRIRIFTDSPGMDELIFARIGSVAQSCPWSQLQQLEASATLIKAVLESGTTSFRKLRLNFLPAQSWYSNLAGLHSLKLDMVVFPPYEPFKALVTAASRLVELSLTWRSPSDSGPVVPVPVLTGPLPVLHWHLHAIVLPFLEHLEILDRHGSPVQPPVVYEPVLQYLRTPALKSLKFNMSQWAAPNVWTWPLIAHVEYPPSTIASIPIRPRHNCLLAQLYHLEITECPPLSKCEAASFWSCLSSLPSLAFAFKQSTQNMYDYLLMTHRPKNACNGLLYPSPGSSEGVVEYPLLFPLPYDKEQPLLPALQRLIVWNLTGAKLKQFVKFRIDQGFPIRSLYFDKTTQTSRRWLAKHVPLVGQFKTSYGDELPDWI